MTLSDFQYDAAEWLAPAVVLLIALVIGRTVWNLVENIAGGVSFRGRGFEQHEIIKVNGERAVIVSMGLTSTSFRIYNGSDDEYRIEANSRLKFLDIRKLVPK